MRNIDKEKIYGNIWIFEVKLKSGESTHSHKHEFDHLHQVISGKAEVTVLESDGTFMFKKEVVSGQILRVPKNYYHSIKALEDYHGNCIHALRDTNGDVVETDFIKDINIEQ